MIAALNEIFYVRSPRDWPWPGRAGVLVALTASIVAAGWMVTRGDLWTLAGGSLLGAGGAGALAYFLRSLRRTHWVRLDDAGIHTAEGESLAYREIDRVHFQDEPRLGRVLRVQSPRVDVQVPIFRKGRDLLVNVPLFLALLEERTGKPRGTLARSAKGDLLL